MRLVFSQKWVAEVLADFFDKPAEDISVEDMASIKYLAFGESFNNDFFIELSVEQPLKPFVNSNGGDEWLFCLRGDDISKLVEEYNGRENAQLSMYGLDREDDKWQKYACSKKAEKLWETFSKSIKGANYYEQLSDDEFEKWYDDIRENAYRDIAFFTGVEVLRIQGLKFPDFGFLDAMPNLRVAEFVETVFVSTVGIEKLLGLEQIACWLD